MLRKRAGKASQRRHEEESSAPKRRKIGENNEFEESRRVEFMKIATSAGEKRKPNGEHEESSEEIVPPEPKRQRKQQRDIRLFLNNKGGKAEPKLTTECGRDQQLSDYQIVARLSLNAAAKQSGCGITEREREQDDKKSM